MSLTERYTRVFLPKSGALAFFVSILVWGIGIGCFYAALNNYLSDIHRIDQYERGWLEFFRELPGLGLVFLLALLHRVSDWKIMRLGTLVSMAGVIGLLVPADKIGVTALVMVWSAGEHLVMPVRNSIAMQIAAPGRAGQSLGFQTGAMNAGTVIGSLAVALIFWCGIRFFGVTDRSALYQLVWIFIFLLMLLSVICTFTPNAPSRASKRPRLYVNWKFRKYYALELFYGARKQVFLTFGPYLLIRNYGMPTDRMALLLGICAGANIFLGPQIGRLTDRIGYRNVMIYDTVILFFVCLLYGFAGDWFPAPIAFWVVVVNFFLDAVISSTSLATNLYLKEISTGADELTSSMTTGISINHLISILAAPFGGWIWLRFGCGALFGFAAAMAVANSLFALTLPRPGSGRQSGSPEGVGTPGHD